jgi:TPR repeat protein
LHAHAQVLLDGTGGERDPEAARALLEAGYGMRSRVRPRTALLLGRLVAAGDGGPRDPERARELLDHAARENVPGAPVELAQLLEAEAFPDMTAADIDALYLVAGKAGDERGWLGLAERRAAAGLPAVAVRQMSKRARDLLEEKATNGHVGAMGRLAALHRNPSLGLLDEARARHWLAEAAAAGSDIAARRLAEKLREDGDLDAAVALLQVAAERGDAGAMIGLIQIAAAERPDAAALERWGEIAIAHGDRHGQYLYGKALLEGTVTTAEPARALNVLRSAATLGHPGASAMLGLELLASTERAARLEGVEWLARAAEAGDASAALRLARAYLQPGELHSSAAAEAWFVEAVALGSRVAKTELGRRLLYGEDLPERAEVGRALLQEAAEAGDPGAMYTLGKAFVDGVAVSGDLGQARYWLGQAAANGSRGASILLNHI